MRERVTTISTTSLPFFNYDGSSRVEREREIRPDNGNGERESSGSRRRAESRCGEEISGEGWLPIASPARVGVVGGWAGWFVWGV